jgi:hypothetical protein
MKVKMADLEMRKTRTKIQRAWDLCFLFSALPYFASALLARPPSLSVSL